MQKYLIEGKKTKNSILKKWMKDNLHNLYNLQSNIKTIFKQLKLYKNSLIIREIQI